jgi:hypothetical protein
MALLGRDTILSAPDLPRETVPVPEWGGEVLVRGLTGAERDAFEESCYTGRGKDRRENFANLRARLVALAIIGEDGTRVFAEADVKALGGKSAAGLDRVFAVIQRLNGLRERDVEDLAGNFEPSPPAGT